MQLSVIIPTLNEQKNIAQLLAQLTPLQQMDCEIIVVDGGSSDETLALASKADKVIQSTSGRALQMNAGAKISEGKILWFVHADSYFSNDIKNYLSAVTAAPNWGFFSVKLNGGQWPFRIIEWMINWRSSLSGVGTGDQALFVDKNIFDSIGGFQAIPLMEDVALSKSLRGFTKAYVVKNIKIVTSSRRWERRGIIKTVGLMWWLRLQYFCGVSPENLAKRYR